MSLQSQVEASLAKLVPTPIYQAIVKQMEYDRKERNKKEFDDGRDRYMGLFKGALYEEEL